MRRPTIGDIDHETLLGDGLYASFDGYHIRLRAPRPPGDDHVVFLDPSVLSSFMTWMECCMEKGNIHGHA